MTRSRRRPSPAPLSFLPFFPSPPGLTSFPLSLSPNQEQEPPTRGQAAPPGSSIAPDWQPPSPDNSSAMAARSSPSTAPTPSDLAVVGNGTASPGSMPPRAHSGPPLHLLAMAATSVMPASSESVRSVRIRSTTSRSSTSRIACFTDSIFF